MRIEDHERIVEAVATIKPKLFSDDVLRRIKKGSVYPDRFETGRAHHYGRNIDILKNILEARQRFLKSTLSDSAFNLGIAFHYVADATCPGSSDRKKHQRWEEEISYCSIPEVSPKEIETPAQIEESITFAGGRFTPAESLYVSVSTCASLLELTWRPLSEKNEKDEHLIEEAKRRMPNIFFALLLYLIPLALPGICFWFNWSVGLIPVLAILACLFGISWAHVYISDKLKAVFWILKWYGLR